MNDFARDWEPCPQGLKPTSIAVLSGTAEVRALPKTRYPATSKMTSSSTGAPSGRLATPYTRRQGLLSVVDQICG
ncbi:MAG TPA: hypothetical protein VGV15_18660, partial [Terriglobales bacterium]|nr:hypothetical protein [Terriglobales bacterium]